MFFLPVNILGKGKIIIETRPVPVNKMIEFYFAAQDAKL
jgi:hypothetical protein